MWAVLGQGPSAYPAPGTVPGLKNVPRVNPDCRPQVVFAGPPNYLALSTMMALMLALDTQASDEKCTSSHLGQTGSEAQHEKIRRSISDVCPGPQGGG